MRIIKNNNELKQQVDKKVQANSNITTIMKYLTQKCPYHGETILFNQVIQSMKEHDKLPSDENVTTHYYKWVKGASKNHGLAYTLSLANS